MEKAEIDLLSNGNKQLHKPSAYCPLFMLDTAGKILERFFHDQVEAVIGHSYSQITNMNSKREDRQSMLSIMWSVQRKRLPVERDGNMGSRNTACL